MTQCRFCHKSALEIKGYLRRVNPKGITGVWECWPSCGVELTEEEKIIAEKEITAKKKYPILPKAQRALSNPDRNITTCVCPHCRVKCEIYEIDPITTCKKDFEAMRCWNCEKLSTFVEDEESYGIDSLADYDNRIEDSQESKV